MGLQPGANPAGNRVPGSEMGLIGVYDMCGNYGKKKYTPMAVFGVYADWCI